MKNEEVPRRYQVKKERHFKPYRDLLGAANCALADARDEHSGCHYYRLTAILMSGLALEAIANTFGEELVEDWKDFETSRPLAKLRIIASKLDIEFSRGQEPWSSVMWLIGVRNSIAHGKPQAINFNEVMPEAEVGSISWKPPLSKIEQQISLSNAERAFNATNGILELFIESMDQGEQHYLKGDSWSSSASLLADE